MLNEIDIASLEVNDPYLRRNYIGASDAPIIMGESPWKSPAKLYREKVGLDIVESTYPMRRGIALEQEARHVFFLETQLSVYPMRVLHREIPWMMASMDGLSFDRTVAVEIKCPMGKDHIVASTEMIPDKYFAQLQHQLEVLDIDEMYYMSYHPDSHYILTIKRDKDYAAKLIHEESQFYDCLINFREPGDSHVFDLCSS